MNYFKRAWLSVVRRKGKSLILLIVIFILGNVIAGAFSIQQASKNVEKKIKLQLGATATVELDWERIDKEQQNNPDAELTFEPVTLKLIEEIANNQYVRYYDYSISTPARSTIVKTVMMDGIESTPDDLGEHFLLTGVQYPKIMDIEEGKMELTSGRVFTDEDISSGKLVTVVSEEFAKTNGITLGDTLAFKTIVTNFDVSSSTETITASRDFSLEVVGIFKPLIREVKDSDDNNSGFDDWQTNELHNRIYIPNKVAYDEMEFMYEESLKVNPDWNIEDYTVEDLIMQSISPIFAIENPETLEAFRSEVTPILPAFQKITTSSDAYDSIAGPVAALDKMAGITLGVAIGATVLILSLVIVLFLRDRKHELGIYLSLGDRRSGVLTQIVIEVAMVALVGLTLSLITGNMIASSLSKNLMSNYTNDDPILYKSSYTMMAPGDVSEEDVIDAYKVKLTPEYVGLFYLIGLGVTIGSTIIPIVYITRLNPKKIMM